MKLNVLRDCSGWLVASMLLTGGGIDVDVGGGVFYKRDKLFIEMTFFSFRNQDLYFPFFLLINIFLLYFIVIIIFIIDFWLYFFFLFDNNTYFVEILNYGHHMAVV